MSKIYVYDIETFPNYFSAIFIDYEEYHKVRKPLSNKKGDLIVSETEKINAVNSVNSITFEISTVEGHEIVDILRLIDFVNQPIYLSGFNNKGYDDNIIKFIILNIYKFRGAADACKKINEFSQVLINTEYAILKNIPAYINVNRHRPYFNSIDLQRIAALDKVFKSLKQTLINVKWHKIQDYKMPKVTAAEKRFYSEYCPVDLLEPWDRYVIKDFIPDILSYNDNDVRGTCELFFTLFEDVKLRFDIGAQFGMYCMCDSKSKIADRFIFKYYCEAANVEYNDIKDLRTHHTRINLGKLLSPVIQFRTIQFNELLERVKHTTVGSTTDVNIKFDYDDTQYSIKSGGLHSEDKPGVFNIGNNILYRDADVNL